ncbi:MAG: proline--tRNA ligase [Magnetococcales bacterium]|nr:proline--tRNA ligase [Magnetococcales bacterium]
MRFTKTLIPTLKETPQEAKVASHRLMLRAGLVRQLGAGIYTWLPLGLRVLRKVEQIVREEMDAAGAMEVLMPAVQPAELWKESGRWDHYGKELLRFQDRHDRDFCFGPTHEEVITDLVRREIRSYKELPINLYQIQTKFRDEIRPRFGIMRGREFLMKDAYSFNLDQESLDQTYQEMYDAYGQIFRRCGLGFRAVEADTGTIGGASSHEFHVLADSGEDLIASCAECDYGANLEKATARASADITPTTSREPLTRVETPGQKTIDQVAGFLKVPLTQTVKSLVVLADGKPHMLLLRGDHTLNEIKAGNLLTGELIIPEPAKAAQLADLPVGSMGPVGSALPILADSALEEMGNFICGANDDGWHLTGVNWGRDLEKPRFADIRNVEAGDPCPKCSAGSLKMDRGIEVGHVFKLGDKYSQAMGVVVLNDQGREQTPLMGCYGIGVSRIVAAAIEQNHDDNGIIWPMGLAPYQLQILLLNPKQTETREVALELYQRLIGHGVEVLLDDRDERPGIKFKEADLLGIPLRVVVGGRSFKQGALEVQARAGGEAQQVPILEGVQTLLRELQGGGDDQLG